MIGRLRGTLLAAAGAVFGFATGAPAAKADIIFDQHFSTPRSGSYSDADRQTRIADDFHLDPGSNTITDIHWWGLYGEGNSPTKPDNFTIQVLGNKAGLPASDPIFELVIGNVERVATGTTIAGIFTEYAYFVNIPALTLEPDTPYWLSIINDTTEDINNDWAWASRPDGSSALFINQSWRSLPLNFSFQLTNDGLVEIPEPATLALFGVGLLGLGMIARRRKAA